MNKTVVQTPAAPAAIGPYSQAIVSGDLVFTSGQIPLDPATGQLVTGDIKAMTERVMDNLGAVLGAAGCGFADVVKTTIFLADMGDFAAVNEVYGKRFTAQPPARSTVQAAALPRGARVEVEAVARKP
jgi:2-iminobutanoate/2-iminopropanoate deaminase